MPYADNLPWPQVVVAFGDERLVPPEDDRSNQQMARRALLDAVHVKPEHILGVDTSLPPAEAAAAYEARLRDSLGLKEGQPPEFDLVFLGLGTDGHTASLFPGMAGVDETTRLVIATPGPDAGGPMRVSVTLPVLNAARLVVFLVQGAEKAAIVRRVVGEAPADERADEGSAALLPAQRVRPTHEGAQVKWFVDEAAAAELRQ